MAVDEICEYVMSNEFCGRCDRKQHCCVASGLSYESEGAREVRRANTNFNGRWDGRKKRENLRQEIRPSSSSHHRHDVITMTPCHCFTDKLCKHDPSSPIQRGSSFKLNKGTPSGLCFVARNQRTPRTDTLTLCRLLQFKKSS